MYLKPLFTALHITYVAFQQIMEDVHVKLKVGLL
jgi:hypothetical protein